MTTKNCRATVRNMKIKSAIVPLAALGLFLVACAARTSASGYTKEGTTEQEFLKDRLACLKQVTPTISDAQMRASASPFGPSSQTIAPCGMLETCLGARGYTVDPDGILEVPATMNVRCRRRSEE